MYRGEVPLEHLALDPDPAQVRDLVRNVARHEPLPGKDGLLHHDPAVWRPEGHCALDLTGGLDSVDLVLRDTPVAQPPAG